MERKLEDGIVGRRQQQDVCSLCGDIGFPDALVLCNKCGFRLQHTYCSRLYPEIDMERWCCEWCLHEEEEKKESKRRRKVFEFLLEIAQSLPQDSSQSPSGIETEKRICRREDRNLPSDMFQVGCTETRDKAAAAATTTTLKKNVRCLEKNNKALDRWRNLAKTKFSCRRYKLLADVHC